MDGSIRLFKDYAYYLKIERGLSPNTVAGYLSDISLFFEESGLEPASVAPADIVDYLSERSDTLSKRSQARMLSAFRSFFDWMILEGAMKENPCDGVDPPKIGRYLPEVLSVQEVDDIIASVDTSTPAGLRDRAILEVLYDGYQDPKYRPCPLLKQYVDAGRLGRKVGRGFYEYD